MSAELIQFQSATNQTSLLELYTSEGCSSCPPAEAWFSRLKSNALLWNITELALATSRPAKVIGTHFLSPVPPTKLLEIVKADTTSEETLSAVKEFGRSLGKEILVAKDTPGFIFNYLLLALTGAAVRLLESGVASAEDIDRSMTLGLGHPIGPLSLADFNGLDVGYMVGRAMYERRRILAWPPLMS